MADQKILLFNRWNTDDVLVADLGLKNQINLKPIILPRSCGRFGPKPFHRNDMNVVERFINKLYVPGHKGKKHKTTSGECVGNSATLYSAVKSAFEIIEQKTKKNPVQVLVTAIENAAAYEEVAAYRLGGIMARKSVVVSPQRRLDLSLRIITQTIYRAGFNKKGSLQEIIARELIAMSNNDMKSPAIMERTRLEKEAEGAR